MPIIIGFALIILLVLMIGWLQVLRARNRTRRLRNAAEMLGFRFSEEGDPRLLSQAARFLIFSIGQTGEMSHVMQGEKGDLPGQPDVAIFEYAFSTPLGRYVESWRQTVVRFASDELDLPDFSLIPEPIFDRMVDQARGKEMRERLMGTASVRFPDHPEFEERAHVLGQDRARVRALLSDDVIAFHRAHPELCIEGSGHSLLCYRYDELVSPAEVDDFLREAKEVYELLARDNEALDEEEREQ